MSRFCSVSVRKRMVGHNVSHANNKTKRLFELNLHPCSLDSQVFGSPQRLRLSVKGMRTVQKKGGLDAFLAVTPLTRLDPQLHTRKMRFDRMQARQSDQTRAT